MHPVVPLPLAHVPALDEPGLQRQKRILLTFSRSTPGVPPLMSSEITQVKLLVFRVARFELYPEPHSSP